MPRSVQRKKARESIETSSDDGAVAPPAAKKAKQSFGDLAGDGERDDRNTATYSYRAGGATALMVPRIPSHPSYPTTPAPAAPAAHTAKKAKREIYDPKGDELMYLLTCNVGDQPTKRMRESLSWRSKYAVPIKPKGIEKIQSRPTQTHIKRPHPPRHIQTPILTELDDVKHRLGFGVNWTMEQFLEDEQQNPPLVVIYRLSGSVDADRYPIWRSEPCGTIRQARESAAQKITAHFEVTKPTKFFPRVVS